MLSGGHALPADTSITSDPRHVEMTYDGLDRMLTETSVGVAHTNSWDKQGNRLQVVQGRTGRIVQSGYDRLNRLVRMEERLPSEPQSRTTLYSYDRNGNVVQKTQANGLVELTEYDALNRRTRQELKQGTSSLNTYAYAYDRHRTSAAWSNPSRRPRRSPSPDRRSPTPTTRPTASSRKTSRRT